MEGDFALGIEFRSVLSTLSKQIYETPLAFIRENVQNAVDAVRIQAARDGRHSGDGSYGVWIDVDESSVTIRDNGIGMSFEDLKNLYWTMGASGKLNQEARDAGCVGMFGIGGFANFGVCSLLRVTSRSMSDAHGTETWLTLSEIENADGTIPKVHSRFEVPMERGTVVRGDLQHSHDVENLRSYLMEFVQYANERIYFNGELLSTRDLGPDQALDSESAIELLRGSWSSGNVQVSGQLFEGEASELHARIDSLTIGGVPVPTIGFIRFENGAISALKRGFKLCSTQIPSEIDISGVVDCSYLAPTAGRDSLNANSNATMHAIVQCMEQAAVAAVLGDSSRISRHTSFFRYIRRNGLVGRIGETLVELADGTDMRLRDIPRASATGGKVFFATSRKYRLAQLLQARGHTVVQLPTDHHKQSAVRDYLTTYCDAEAFEGQVEVERPYLDLSRFEKLFLAELEETVLTGFDVHGVTLTPGALSEDVPVYADESAASPLVIYVDVRHAEIAKLEALGVSGLFRSMVAAFCREYLAPSLRAHSPKFFGSGAVNLDFLAKRRTELWVLSSNDIGILNQGGQRQVVRSSDVRVVTAGRAESDTHTINRQKPKLIQLQGSVEFANLFGYYLRVPDSASVAYGDVVVQCDDRAAVWAGNRIGLHASDGISTAFQFEVRLDKLIVESNDDRGSGGVGAEVMERPIQQLYDGLYFPIPTVLEPYLVPTSIEEVRIEVRCEWTDFSSARAWSASD